MSSQTKVATVLEIYDVGDATWGGFNGSGSTTLAASLLGDGSDLTGAVTILSGPPYFTDWLLLSAFGFTIPGTSVVHGILASIRRKATVAGGDSYLTDDGIYLRQSGPTHIGSNLATAAHVASSPETVTYGGSANLWGVTPPGGVSWVDYVNSTDFGVVLYHKLLPNPASYAGTMTLYEVALTVYYAESADPSHTTAVVPSTGLVGYTTTATVTAKDSSGTPVGAGGDTVVVTVTGANSATPTVTDHGDGTYTATYTPTAAGSDSVAITLGGTDISGSPYASEVSGAPAPGSFSNAQLGLVCVG